MTSYHVTRQSWPRCHPSHHGLIVVVNHPTRTEPSAVIDLYRRRRRRRRRCCGVVKTVVRSCSRLASFNSGGSHDIAEFGADYHAELGISSSVEQRRRRKLRTTSLYAGWWTSQTRHADNGNAETCLCLALSLCSFQIDYTAFIHCVCFNPLDYLNISSQFRVG